MQPFNEKYAAKVARAILTTAEAQDRFLEALRKGTSAVPALIRMKAPEPRLRQSGAPVWQPDFVELALNKKELGRSAAHEQGEFYLLDLSSVFAVSPLVELKEVNCILDLCASPGGKGIFAWRALTPKQIIFNEVIGKRTAALISNIKRCGVLEAFVVSSDSDHFAKTQRDVFDLVLVDAPCSGQSLIAQGQKSVGCFNPATINMNANRQRRIIANAASSVAPGKYLLYMTCTYSTKENEEVAEWFLKNFPEFRAIEVGKLSEFRSALSEFPCYRLFPEQGFGAGAFTTLFKRAESGERADLDLSALRIIWPK